MERRVVVSADPPNYESRLDQVARLDHAARPAFRPQSEQGSEIDPETYRLKIEGDAVGNPIELSLRT